MTSSQSKLKSKSLLQYLNRSLVVIAATILLLLFHFLTSLQWETWNIAMAMVASTLLIWLLLYQFSQRILVSFRRAVLHLEAIKVEDYHQYAKPDFAEGCTAELHLHLKELSNHLQSQKSRYDQHAFLLYQLIDQLNTPIMVFNQKLKLSYANTAFTMLYDQPWQMYRMASPNILGLLQTEQGWKLRRTDQQWQVSESEFIDAGQTHTLLVFTNIDLAIRASQQSAWQQIIRVMGHEIRNSLTPVSSLAESLTHSLSTDRERKALSVISERCEHLQDFINRYSTLSQQLNLNIQTHDAHKLVERIKPLFSEYKIDFIVKISTIDVDAVFFEQILINLIKNAIEAGANKVIVSFTALMPISANTIEVVVKDNGQGIANTDNLFVPLFTTKPEGQGIGLTFCRNTIEQHQGTIELFNNNYLHSSKELSINQPQTRSSYSHDGTINGASVVIKLPQLNRHSPTTVD